TDIDPAEMNKNGRTAVMLQSDVKSALRLLNANLSRQSHPLWCQRVHAFGRVIPRNEAGGIAPGELVRAVAAVCGEDAYVATDVGQHQMWTAQFYPLSAPGRFLTSGGLGTMGFGLGAAIGAQLAHPEATVALFTGDGSFRMNLNELATVAAYGLPIRMILLRNNSLGMIRQWQDASFGGRHSQSDLPALDYCAIARAYGLRAVALEETPGWQERLAEALREPGPVLIECPIRPDNKVLPTVKPGDTLESLALSAHEL
ncbi:MAG: thiamine pyrophosphate-dependent enzyme, partial [Eubacteriales bacterium]|nr:thiamine pyrophosphate-dependent enzyme [Eubacteriales bacterium]